MKLQQSIFLIIISITIPALVISGSIIYYSTEDQLTENILNQINSAADVEKLIISEIIDKNYERLELIKSRTQLRISLENYLESQNLQDKEKVNRILSDAKFSIEDITDLHIIDSNGIVLFSTTNSKIGLDFIDSPIFRDSHFENTINTFSSEGNIFLVSSGPLRLNNNFLGVLASETNFELETKIVKDIIGHSELEELIISVKDENGDAKIITPLLYTDNSEIIIHKTDLNSPIIHSLMQHESTFDDHLNYNDMPVISASRYISETGWGLTFEIPKEEAFTQLIQIQLIIIFSAVLVTMISIIASLIISNSLTKPIHKLQNVTREISQGKLKEKITISGSDEIKNLANDVNIMQNNLKQAQKDLVKSERILAIGELSSRLAHDIRNPLSVIKLSLELWKKNHKEMTEKEVKNFDMIERNTSKIKYLVENVLDFVRSREPKYEKISLQEILQNLNRSISLSKNITLFLPANDIIINCDPNQIEIVLENLITNSAQAIGKASGSITINFNEENENVIILVRDTGMGIPEDIISKIFDPLFTTKIEGTGLGLASCKSIIESHRGTLTVKNNPTTFKITLPKNLKI